jgi:acetoin:2,6-dichlorophenolindophenol oxidoreductase subunit alpha
MAKQAVDGNDLSAVRAATSEAVGRARSGAGPTFIEALTYRHKGHSRSDPATYRPAGELEAWLERDPIPRHERVLLDAAVSRERLDEVRATAEADVAAALERARGWPEPPPDARFDDVYA